MPGRTPTHRATPTPPRDATRRQLLDAAGRLFAERGYHATSVPDIVRAAGVGHGTFYENFGSRPEILAPLPEHAASGPRRPRLQSGTVPERIRIEIAWFLA